MDQDKALRDQIAKFIDWKEAHAHFDSAVDGVELDQQGLVPKGAEHSLWQLLEHLRVTQEDILDFCRNPGYEEKSWPEDYWPKSPKPPDASAWAKSIAGFRKDLEDMKRLASDSSVDLFVRIPHGSGQTYLRELLLVADHNAYHVGQMVLLRRQLGIWPS